MNKRQVLVSNVMREDKELIIGLYVEAGLSVPMIAHWYNFHPGVIYKRFYEWGVDCRPDGKGSHKRFPSQVRHQGRRASQRRWYKKRKDCLD